MVLTFSEVCREPVRAVPCSKRIRNCAELLPPDYVPPDLHAVVAGSGGGMHPHWSEMWFGYAEISPTIFLNAHTEPMIGPSYPAWANLRNELVPRGAYFFASSAANRASASEISSRSPASVRGSFANRRMVRIRRMQ